MRKILISYCQFPITDGTTERIFQVAYNLTARDNPKGIKIQRNLQLVKKPVINKISNVFFNIPSILSWLVHTYKLGKYDIGQFEGITVFKALYIS
jgi:hypothetical protein